MTRIGDKRYRLQGTMRVPESYRTKGAFFREAEYLRLTFFLVRHRIVVGAFSTITSGNLDQLLVENEFSADAEFDSITIAEGNWKIWG